MHGLLCDIFLLSVLLPPSISNLFVVYRAEMGTGERTRDGTHSHIGNGIYV
jgi:uncharacterized membrane protein